MAAEAGEFRRGWRFVLGAFIGIGGGFASLYFYTAGLFIKPLAEEFQWTRGEASLSALSFMIGNTIALPIAGRLVDRFGEVRVALTSGTALAAAFAMLGSLTGGLTSFLLLVLLLTMASAGSTAVSYNRVIVRHFKAQRGLALGLALTGSAIGAAIVPPLLAPFIAEHGWRPAYYVLAVLAFVLTGCAALLLRETGPRADLQAQSASLPWRVICSHPAFFSISAMIFLSATAVLGTTLHIVPMLTDGGLDLAAAGSTASALGISVIGGRVIAGRLLDRWDAGWVTWILLTLAAFGMLLLWTGYPALVIPGAMLVGFGVGTEGDLLAYLLGRRFPIRSFGSVYGAIFAVHAFGAGIGGMLAGALYDVSGNYGSWLLAAAAALVVAGLIALATERGIKALAEE
ncbi:MFS transporter [Sphingopyxis sp. GC21]|uniref:MFS transporter n=1 Tax=Sphingopyxis sp. GC21 TaxID=2933562 RepID=UPI0021E49414|nr:MFS transporter [Sphingopyxis sp. GC21]